MPSKDDLITSLTAQLEQNEKMIDALRSQLEEALEINQDIREPSIDSFYDL